MRRVVLLIIIMLLPLDGFAQEENHKHEQYRHPEYAKIKNPIAKTEKSVAQGRRLYEKHCTVCHGADGKGGIGPALAVPSRIHGSTDGEMFHVITDGVAGTAMKGFGKEQSNEMRWHLVNYSASLRKNETNK